MGKGASIADDLTWGIMYRAAELNLNGQKNFKINISEKKEKCLHYRHNLKQKKRPFGRAQNITMPKY